MPPQTPEEQFAELQAMTPEERQQLRAQLEGQLRTATQGPSNTPASILGGAMMGGLPSEEFPEGRPPTQPTGPAREEFERGGVEGALAVPATIAAVPAVVSGVGALTGGARAATSFLGSRARDAAVLGAAGAGVGALPIIGPGGTKGATEGAKLGIVMGGMGGRGAGPLFKHGLRRRLTSRLGRAFGANADEAAEAVSAPPLRLAREVSAARAAPASEGILGKGLFRPGRTFPPRPPATDLQRGASEAARTARIERAFPGGIPVKPSAPPAARPPTTGGIPGAPGSARNAAPATAGQPPLSPAQLRAVDASQEARAARAGAPAPSPAAPRGAPPPGPGPIRPAVPGSARPAGKTPSELEQRLGQSVGRVEPLQPGAQSITGGTAGVSSFDDVVNNVRQLKTVQGLSDAQILSSMRQVYGIPMPQAREILKMVTQGI